jgi:hypothetical protein
MSKRRYYEVECLETFTDITPANVLEIRNLAGEVVDTIETPEYVREYQAGQRISISSKVHLRAFCKAHPGKFREVAS